jgi:hypothetical protein
MRTLIFTSISVIAATAALSLRAGSAYAEQLAISQPAPIEVFESRFSTTSLEFELVNTGVPVFDSIHLVLIGNFVLPVDGDVTREVLSTGIINPCRRDLGEVVTFLNVGESCKVLANYFISDGDPFDSHQVVDSARWAAAIEVTWSFFAETLTTTQFQFSYITIKDDPIPEPSTWTMMLTGFAGMAAALRYSRRHPGRARHSPRSCSARSPSG